MRIPQGQLIAKIPVESCKAYPIQLFKDLNMIPRIAYADLNTRNEQDQLLVKLLPYGAKTAAHPQIAFFVRGPYHIETLGYIKSNPDNWTTWMEIILTTAQAEHLKEALFHTRLQDLKT